MIPRPPRSTLFPYRRSSDLPVVPDGGVEREQPLDDPRPGPGDRKSTRLNSSHVRISYAVFCLKKKNHRRRPCNPSPLILTFLAPINKPHPATAQRRYSTRHSLSFFFFNDTATTEIYTLSLHDALPISRTW